jgi:Amt family ammonium transporter
MKFSAFTLFILLWATLVYDPIAHMVWGVGGWLRSMGTLDFAGGTVVHVSSGVSALAAALVIGHRHGYGREPMPPHNLPITLLGAGLLWFGWFGFNAGSALGAGSLATNAFVATHVATAAATLVWVLLEWIDRGKPTLLGAASGAVAGLVAITPACGFVTPMGGLAIGGAAGGICQLAVNAKNRLGYDDSLDAFGIHGVGGTWGALATGCFATVAVNAAGADGLFYGNPALVWTQLKAVVFTWVYAFVVSFVILKVLDLTIGLRVAPQQEQEGLDLTQHSEKAYEL